MGPYNAQSTVSFRHRHLERWSLLLVEGGPKFPPKLQDGPRLGLRLAPRRSWYFGTGRFATSPVPLPRSMLGSCDSETVVGVFECWRDTRPRCGSADLDMVPPG